MRLVKSSLGILLAGTLLVPAVGYTQGTATELRLRSIEARLPDADKLAELERKVNRLSSSGGAAAQGSNQSGDAPADGSMFSLLQDVQSMQEDMRKLRGEVEELKFKLKQNEQGQRDLYQNLDERMQALEKGGTSNRGGGSNGGASAGVSGGSGSGPVDEAAAEQAYQSAFNLLKQGDYAKSITEFNAFVKEYPGSQYSDNAWYWLGEAHYVDRQYDEALKAFKTVQSDFPDSRKAAGALYKIGVIQDEQGNTGAAQTTLSDVVKQYPDDNAAELARKRLKAIAGGSGN